MTNWKIWLYSLLLLQLNAIAGYGQNYDSLRNEQQEVNNQIKELQGKLNTLQAKAKSLDDQMLILDGWRTGVVGTFGFNQSTFNNWIKGANPNSTSSTINITINGFVRKKGKKSFWRNSGALNLGWQKLDINTEEGEEGRFENVADVLKLTSVYGRNFSKKLAFSALAEYNTAVLSNLNNPGIFDFGAGFTWIPDDDIAISVHPLNYHWVFGDNPDFNSGLGAKFVADVTKTFFGDINWRSNLTSFVPYQSQQPSLMELTWTNGLTYNAWKRIGVSVEFAFRTAPVELDELQSYTVLGLSYSL